MAYIRTRQGGLRGAGGAGRAASKSSPAVPIPTLDELLDSDKELPDVIVSSSLPRSARPVPPAPSSPPPPPTTSEFPSDSTVEDLITSSTLSFLASTVRELATYVGLTLAAYCALFALKHALPYPIRFLHFALRHLERLVQFLVWLSQWIAIVALGLLGVGLAGLALAYVWYKWGERAWDGRAPFIRAVFVTGTVLAGIWRFAPVWARYLGVVGLVGAGWRLLDEPVRDGLRLLVLHPRQFHREAMVIYEEKKAESERDGAASSVQDGPPSVDQLTPGVSEGGSDAGGVGGQTSGKKKGRRSKAA